MTKGFRETDEGLIHAKPALPLPLFPEMATAEAVGVAAALVDVFLVLVVTAALVVVLTGLVVEVETTATELEVGLTLQRPVVERFFFAMSWWWPKLRAWLGDMSRETALAGAGPNEQTRSARDATAARLRSLAAMA